MSWSVERKWGTCATCSHWSAQSRTWGELFLVLPCWQRQQRPRHADEQSDVVAVGEGDISSVVVVVAAVVAVVVWLAVDVAAVIAKGRPETDDGPAEEERRRSWSEQNDPKATPWTAAVFVPGVFASSL